MIVFIGVNVFSPETFSPKEYFETHYALGWTDFDVSGKVTEKYLSPAHNNPTIILDCVGKEYEFYFHTNDTEFYDYLHIGDSIISKRKSFSAIVRRNETDSIFNFIDDN